MKKVLIGIMIAIAVIGASMLGYMYYRNSNKTELVPENKPEQLDSIDSFEYKLEDRDTALFKEEYEKLKNVLLAETIDYEEYAKLLSQLYIIDLYTINNKVSKYDVGGGDYVYPKSRDNFELKVRDTIYKYLEDNSFNTRNQNLPEVSTIEVERIEETKYKIEETEYKGYKLNLKWEYTKEEEYDKTSIISVIRDKDKLYIAEQMKKGK